MGEAVLAWPTFYGPGAWVLLERIQTFGHLEYVPFSHRSSDSV